MRNSTFTRFWSVLSILLLVTAFAAPPAFSAAASSAPASSAEGSEVIGGNLPVDGQVWKIVTPAPLAKWNGTLIVDLDAAPAITSNSPMVQWLVAHGYAYGGINRDKVTYRYDIGAERLVMVRQAFIDHYKQTPKRNIVRGSSRGSNVARHTIELYPEIFQGAVTGSGGGAGLLSTMLLRLDSQFVLKTLVDPASPLKIVKVANKPADIRADEDALTALVKKADSTALGRARLALAGAVSQTGGWLGRNDPEPAATDYDGQYKQLLAAYVGMQATSMASEATEIAEGNILWNNGVDYAVELSQSGRDDFVKAMYAKVGDSGAKQLEEDVRTLAKAPRISADPKAVNKAEKFLSYTGKVGGPVMALNNIGDVNYPPAKEMAYDQTLTRAGNGALHGMAFVRAAAHGNLNALEHITAFNILIDRLDTGQWHYTTAEEKTALAQKIKSETTIPLPDSRFMNYQPVKALRTWDVSNHGTYKP